MKPTRIQMRHGQQGVALIEALIGILIFAFGVLGLMGLQAAMTKAQTSAKVRADAANLASDLFGLIQTDIAANLPQYAYKDSGKACATYVPCKDWLAKVGTTLPAGSAVIAIDAGTGKVDIEMTWRQGAESPGSYKSSMVWQQ